MTSKPAVAYIGVAGLNEFFNPQDPLSHYFIDAGDGADIIDAFALDDYLIGGLGHDYIKGEGGNDFILGDRFADDNFVGASAAESADADAIEGGYGNDTIYGGGGNNFVNGGAGNDMINGGSGNELLEGGSDNDTVNAGAGNDILVGGTFKTATEQAFISANIGGVITSHDGLTDLFAVHAESGSGFAGTNAALSATGNDLLNGGAGADKIYGQDGSDSLDGGSGKDSLFGGAGADSLTGGSGADHFIFTKLSESGPLGASRDRIADFSHAQGDKIDLKKIDAKTGVSDNNEFHFIGTKAFHHVKGELHYSVSGGSAFVSGDTNGDGNADFSIELDHVTHLVAGDFIL